MAGNLMPARNAVAVATSGKWRISIYSYESGMKAKADILIHRVTSGVNYSRNMRLCVWVCVR